MRYLLLLATVSVAPAWAGVPDPVRVYLPFDGDVKPAVGGGAKAPRTRKHKPPVFAPGLRGQALVVGGGIGHVSYVGPEYADPNRGTVSLWAQAVDWDSGELKGTHFFNMPPHVFLYRYGRWPHTMSFYCKYPDYGWHKLYTGRLELPKGRWVHVAVTWLDRVVCLYADGQPVASHALWKPMTREHIQGLSFGAYGDHRTLIDEFYVFNYPLGPAEIAALAASSRDGSAPTLPKASTARAYVVHYPGVGKVDAYVEAVDAAVASRATTARVVAVPAKGTPVPLGEVGPLRAGRANARLALPERVPVGAVRIEATLLDAAGATVATTRSQPVEKRIYPWQQVQVGATGEVICPFTPLKVTGRSVRCWGREYRFGPDGWPEQIVTRDASVLASPIALVGRVDGRALGLSVAKPMAVGSAKPSAVEFEAGLRAGALAVRVRARMEYDGTVIYTLTLDPARRTTVQALRLDIPIKKAHARLYHACRDAIRTTNEAGFVPDGQGTVWGSSAKKSRLVLGTFLPYLWVGDYDRGLCWMCDTDKGWSVGDDQDALELVREGDVVTCRIHFFRRPKAIDGPWQVQFAIQAGPPRPEPEGWRLGWGLQKTRLGWHYNAKTCQGYGKPPYMDKFVKYATSWRKDHGCGWGVNTSPNDFWLLPGTCEENRYFQHEWRPGYPSLLRNNFVAYGVDQLMKQGLVEGMYSDDVYPRATANFVTGTGYVREDGKIQAGYSMFALRDFYKRLATVHHRRKGKYGLLVHMTDSMIMPAYCFWDAKHDNEWGRRMRGKSLIKAFPLDEIAARCMSRQYGMAASWHTQPRAHGDDLGVLVLLHDMLGRVESMQERVLRAKIAFGINEPDVEFVGYWVTRVKSEPASRDIRASAWVRRKQGTALVTIGNLSQSPWQGRVRLPLATLGLPADAVACDGEDQRPSLPMPGGALTVAVAPENYRIVLVGKPGAFEADLPVPGATLPKPATLIPELCDDFNRPTLGPSWRLAASPKSGAAIETYRNRLSVLASPYKYGSAERDLGVDNVTVQVRVDRPAPSMQHRVGLALVWQDGTCAYAGPSMHKRRQQFEYTLFIDGKAKRRRWGSPVGKPYPYRLAQPNWVRIRLAPKTIVFSGSSDGKTWHEDWQADRPKAMAGAPRVLRLGDTPDGWVGPYRTSPRHKYLDDLVVGR